MANHHSQNRNTASQQHYRVLCATRLTKLKRAPTMLHALTLVTTATTMKFQTLSTLISMNTFQFTARSAYHKRPLHVPQELLTLLLRSPNTHSCQFPCIPSRYHNNNSTGIQLMCWLQWYRYHYTFTTIQLPH